MHDKIGWKNELDKSPYQAKIFFLIFYFFCSENFFDVNNLVQSLELHQMRDARFLSSRSQCRECINIFPFLFLEHEYS